MGDVITILCCFYILIKDNTNNHTERMIMLGGKGLIVDDDTDILTMLTRLCKKLGVNVITAQNGVEAVDILLSTKINFILTDFHMPGMDGGEIVNFVEQNFPEIPVFVMTSDLDGLSERIKKMVFVRRVFKKPFPISAIARSLIVFSPELIH